MKETAFYFGEPRLFGVFHAVESPATKPAFVFCHPFGEEKLWAHRVMVSYARDLARAGHPVLRFDYRGNGDSDGDFAASSLTTAVEDVRTAMRQVRTLAQVDRVSLLGLRFGALVAACVAEDEPELRQLVLWAPIVDGARYMQDLLRINLATQLSTYKEVRQDREALVAQLRQGASVNVDGYDMMLPMYDEVSAMTLGKAPRRYAGRCLVVQADRQDRPQRELVQLVESFPSATLAVAQEEPFWKEIQRFYQEAPNLFACTTDWLSTQ